MRSRSQTVSDTGRELFELLKAYGKQETLDPLRNLGRYLGVGLAGALLLATGIFFLALSGLRALQTTTGDAFTGIWSFAPYAIVAVVLAGIAALAASRINKGAHTMAAPAEERSR